jgi:hypothetical protein
MSDQVSGAISKSSEIFNKKPTGNSLDLSEISKTFTSEFLCYRYTGLFWWEQD